ncbi:hypothetical protein PYCCODRAFT_1398522 [Trametes coccinea BRFM310]|uniref:Queuosine 5'-phosphate N-glycosylase/hydrolase n=1 Tax=Trametes coccinea (strain BRFM310) TaxID=1353009 RepID=A0A1Y2I9Z2_TRAC3|nr:hypothetical protein PYCCODRAFT_1398522 [Trametes coccinea BRFM310]
MTVTILSPTPDHHSWPECSEAPSANGKEALPRDTFPDGVNPALETSRWAMQELNLVSLNEAGIASAAHYIHAQMQRESYTPRTWRTHPLHLSPPEPFSWDDPSTSACLDWIFLISSLNFSFWSELEAQPGRYGVEWREGWGSERRVVHTGYWSLVAAVDRALEEGIPVTSPSFYSSESHCPDELIEHVFRRAPQSVESIPLLQERIDILRENGRILCERFDGSFCGFIQAFRARYNDRGTALQLVKMVTDTFPSFRDEVVHNGRRVYLWKRAQILVAETWAAFYPPSSRTEPHPLFPAGAAIAELTMFADYRVPQILHHLRILSYPPALVKRLLARTPLAPGSAEELSIRAGSIVAVERVRRAILDLVAQEDGGGSGGGGARVDGAGEDVVSSVVIDFYLWDLAKRAEGSPEGVHGVETAPMLPIHRTRSIWY